MELLLLAEEAHSSGPTEVQNRDGRLKDLPAVGGVPEGQGLDKALFTGDRAGR